VLRRGFPEQIIPALAQEYSVDTVHFQAEVTAEEVAVVLSVAEQLSSCDESR
jgi:deoxyribodipyrimidine photo-lyase